MPPVKSFNNQDLPAKKLNTLITSLIVILLILVGTYLIFNFLSGKNNDGVTAPKNALGEYYYQAVFLSNSQVYFGHVSQKNDQYVVLEDIYYLRVRQAIQPTGEGAQPDLIKLGSELHGPVDRMEINKDHVLFIEDLKDDSQVVQAIERYKGGE